MSQHTPPQKNVARLTNGALRWRGDGQPTSAIFDDIYFSSASGIEETRHVFINANQLTGRFNALSDGDVFTIGETGFGTGLNFLCAWQHFEQQAPDSAQLHFISTEKFPLRKEDLQRSLAIWPELNDYANALTDCHFSACKGHQHVKFANGRIRLTMLFGDALNTLPELDGIVDAWFLDGFSPAKNPDMWQPALFQAMAAKSHPNTTYATFTAARFVRNGLTEAGFTVEKISGFGRKRDMIRGHLNKTPISSQKRPIWLQTDTAALPNKPSSENKRAIVVGGGLSGCSTARALAEKGWRVILLEQHNRLAQEASGNPQGILYCKLSPHQTPLSQLIIEGYLYTLNLMTTFDDRTNTIWHPGGVIQLATDDKTLKRHKALANCFPEDILSFHNKTTLSNYANIALHHDGLYFPAAGWVAPARLCAALANHPNIDIYPRWTLTKLSRAENLWSLTAVDTMDGSTESFTSPHVVIACATASKDLTQTSFLPLKSIRGQVSRVAATAPSTALKTTVCAEGYAAPAVDGFHTLGATFDFQNTTTDVFQDDHNHNLLMQSNENSDFYQALGGKEARVIDGRAALRCTTPDYLPVVGRVVDTACFIEDFAMLRKNTKYRFTAPPIYHDGLYINAGHGSRGLITCPLSGEVLAALMNGESSPLSTSVMDHLNPTRFLVRALAKNQ